MTLHMVLLALFVLAQPLSAQPISRLPDWAQAPAQAAQKETPPVGADAWVLLQRTEFAYVGSGEMRIRQVRLVRILSERGLEEARFQLDGFGGKASSVDKLKGWNLRADGEMEKLDKDHVIQADGTHEGHGGASTGQLTLAVLPRVAVGSLVAFESLATYHSPMGPIDLVGVMEANPIRRWEVSVASRGGWFSGLKDVAVQLDLHHEVPWITNLEKVNGQSLAASNLPPLPKYEKSVPNSRNVLPWVLIRFHDPELLTVPSTRSWDEMASWFYGQYAPRFIATKTSEMLGKSRLEKLQSIRRWMARELTYKAVYLSPERGWIPEPGPEVIRRHYGDCKDLATCFLSEAKGLGFEVAPVHARINEGEVEVDELVSPFAFNHLIAAVRLDASLGLASEVETPKGRFLLVDATDRFTPLGLLGAEHRNRRVLISLKNEGIWVTIPESATLLPTLDLKLEATAGEGGRLEGTLTIHEIGNAHYLQHFASELGTADYRRALPKLLNLDLPPTSTLEVLKVSDPLDQDHPFELVLKISDPNGYRREGVEMVMAAWGLPAVPESIQKAGHPRKYPVLIRGCEQENYQASIHIPFRVQPVLPAQSIQTSLRNAEWKSSVQIEGVGSILHLEFHQTLKNATFGFGQLEQGVSECKKDRLALKNLLDDGRSSKLDTAGK